MRIDHRLRIDRLKRKIPRKSREEWKIDIYEERYNLILSVILLVMAGILDYYFGAFAEKYGTAVAPDILLNIIPPINLSWLFVYGYMLVIFMLVAYPIFYDFKRLPVVISHFSLLVAVRALFITMTHLKVPATAIATSFPWPLSLVAFHNDLFFSGHTAIPLVGFFVFRESKIRYFFLISSIILAITVLVMHRHYTIDVASAFFIAYGTYKIGNILFSKLTEHQKRLFR